jgi:hypothetical protein
VRGWGFGGTRAGEYRPRQNRSNGVTCEVVVQPCCLVDCIKVSEETLASIFRVTCDRRFVENVVRSVDLHGVASQASVCLHLQVNFYIL